MLLVYWYLHVCAPQGGHQFPFLGDHIAPSQFSAIIGYIEQQCYFSLMVPVPVDCGIGIGIKILSIMCLTYNRQPAATSIKCYFTCRSPNLYLYLYLYYNQPAATWMDSYFSCSSPNFFFTSRIADSSCGWKIYFESFMRNPLNAMFWIIFQPWSHFPKGAIFEGCARVCSSLEKTLEPESSGEMSESEYIALKSKSSSMKVKVKVNT